MTEMAENEEGSPAIEKVKTFEDDTAGDVNIPTEYDLNKKGLFVFIINQRFEYSDGVVFSDGTAIHHNLDTERVQKDLENLRGIVPDHYILDEDILIAENLMPDPSQAAGNHVREDDVHYYNGFLRKVEQKVKEKRPSFIFMYVLSHGDDDCTFLLASHDGGGKKMCAESCNDWELKHKNETVHHSEKPIEYPHFEFEQTNDQKHRTLPGTCHRRSFNVLVSRIQNIEGDARETYKDGQGNEKRVKVMCGKPKIFLADFCRFGENSAGIPLKIEPGQRRYSSELEDQNSDGVHVIPGADTIILYATLQYKTAYDLLLTTTLSEVVMNLKTLTFKQMNTLCDEVQNSPLQELRSDRNMTSLRVEDFVDGWLLDVFNQVCHDVGFKLGLFEKQMRSGEQIESQRHDKQIPEICSTLTLKLSALEMFRQLDCPSHSRIEYLAEPNDHSTELKRGSDSRHGNLKGKKKED